MYLTATSSPLVLSRISWAVPKAPVPSSRTCRVNKATVHKGRKRGIATGQDGGCVLHAHWKDSSVAYPLIL